MALTPAEKQKAYRERQRLKAMGQLPAAPAPCNIPATRRWAALIAQARTALETARDEMQAYHDDRSEDWQESDRGQEFAETISALETLTTDLDELQMP